MPLTTPIFQFLIILRASLAPAASIQNRSLTSRTLGSKRPREEKLLPLPSLLATRLMVLIKVFKSLLVLRTQRAGNLDKKLRTERETVDLCRSIKLNRED